MKIGAGECDSRRPDPTAIASRMIALITGVGARIRNGTAFDVPPPGVGLWTVTIATPGTLTSLAEMAAMMCRLSTQVVGRSDPFHLTTELFCKNSG